MKQFLLCVRKVGPQLAPDSMNNDKHFVERCREYGDFLRREGYFVSSQTTEPYGLIVARAEHGWSLKQIDPETPLIRSYYIINAPDMNAALGIASKNPALDYIEGLTIEVSELRSAPVFA